MSFRELIRADRKKRGLNEADYGKLLNVSRGTIQQWEKEGGTAPNRNRQPLVAELLGVSISELMSGGSDTTEGPKIGGRVPLLSNVQAGSFKEFVDNNHPGDGGQELIPTSVPVQRHTFALRVSGDSMEPDFREGMILIIEPELEPNPGDFVIAKNGGGETTFKQLVKDGPDWYLKPLNERYPVKPLGNSTIVGVLRAVENATDSLKVCKNTTLVIFTSAMCDAALTPAIRKGHMKSLFLALMLPLIQSTAIAEPVTPRIKQIAERSVKAALKDPGSARFSGLTAFTVDGVLTVCGNVNAKNSYGGYTGKQRFWAAGAAPILESVRFAGDEANARIVDSLCDEQGLRASHLALEKARQAEAVADRTAICKANATSSECVELIKRCEREFGKAFNQEQRSYLTLCRQQGLDVAKAKFQSTLGETITFDKPPAPPQ